MSRPTCHRPNRPSTALVSLTAAALLATFLLVPTASQAADDPSIKGKLRTDIQAAMQTLIDDLSVDGALVQYDPVDGKILELREPVLHAGIVKKGHFYVSCADFKDQQGRKIDVDFLVLDHDGQLRATQALVHKIDGNKRPYDLEAH